MASLGTIDDFTVMRLRVKGSNLDPLAVRPRLQSLLGEIRLRPLLPETASLFIRKLEDPLPGMLRLEAIDSRATQTWQRGLNAKFEQLVTSAAHPAHGPVSSSAESVVFLDYSELLACLTADWCNGFVGARWWWHSFLKRGDIEQVIKQYWREKIEYVPAALQRLSRMRVLVEFVETLSDGEARELVERLADRFALAEVKRVVLALPEQFEALREVPISFLGPSSPVAPGNVRLRSVAPWKHVVPESATSMLRPVQQLFLGLGLMIRRAPAQVRTQSFAREVERWVLLVSSDSRVEVGDEIQSTPEVVQDLVPAAQAPSRKVTGKRVNTDETDQERIQSDGVEMVREEPSSLVSDEVEETISVGSPRDQFVESLPEVSVIDEPPVVATPQATDIAPQPFVELEESFTIETELGGFFYLINLAIFLEIYNDFTNPVETFTDLNIWDFVALVGSELNEYQNGEDPIWALLARFAGHEEVFSRKDAKSQRQTSGSRRSELCDFASLREKTPIWLSRLMPGIRERLHGALGDCDLADVVCRHHARVRVTDTHIDVHFSLAELPIEIRVAGLDRDPGWVPAAGCFIAFHFE